MPTNTTAMALSSPSNPNSLTVSAASQSSSSSILSTNVLTIGDKDDLSSVSPQLIQQHDLATSCEPVASNDESFNDGIIGKPLSSPSANVNGLIACSITNGASSDIMNADHESLSPKMNPQQHSPPMAASLSSLQQHCELDTIDLNIKNIAIGSNSSSNIVDINCLNIVTSSSPTSLSSSSSAANVLNNNQFLNGATTTNGQSLMAQQSNSGAGGSSLNFQVSNSPDSSPWSIGGDVDNSSFVNYSFANNGLHKRPIMSQQPHHGLSPNSGNGNSSSSGGSIIGNNLSQQQQYIHMNKNGNNSSFTSPWSNPPMPWQSHHHQQQQQQLQHHQQQQLEQQILHQQQQSNWNNRGRSVPGMNSMSPHLQQSHQRKHQPSLNQYSMPPSASSSCTQGLLSPNSPSKYRRSTSYPGKHQQQAMHNSGYQMDAMGGGIIEDQTYMSAAYQVRMNKIFNFMTLRVIGERNCRRKPIEKKMSFNRFDGGLHIISLGYLVK